MQYHCRVVLSNNIPFNFKIQGLWEIWNTIGNKVFEFWHESKRAN